MFFGTRVSPVTFTVDWEPMALFENRVTRGLFRETVSHRSNHQNITQIGINVILRAFSEYHSILPFFANDAWNDCPESYGKLSIELKVVQQGPNQNSKSWSNKIVLNFIGFISGESIKRKSIKPCRQGFTYHCSVLMIINKQDKWSHNSFNLARARLLSNVAFWVLFGRNCLSK